MRSQSSGCTGTRRGAMLSRKLECWAGQGRWGPGIATGLTQRGREGFRVPPPTETSQMVIKYL